MLIREYKICRNCLSKILVYAYTFTNYGDFTNGNNAVTPIPSWPQGSFSYVTVSTAEGAPQRVDGRMAASTAPGLGIEPRMDVLGEPELVVE